MTTYQPSIDRYNLIIEIDDDDPETIQTAEVVADPEGDYVVYDDHIEDRLKLVTMIGELSVERDILLCEVERLKEGLEGKELDSDGRP